MQKGSDFTELPESTAAVTDDGITYGTLYQHVSDMPDDKVVYVLPKEDYRDACYMWQVPNGEVVIPGVPLYRMPTTKAVMTNAFGFMPSDQCADFGVLALSDCSDWMGYAMQREAGNWKQIQEKILQQAVPVQSTAPAAAPTGWNWEDCTKIMGAFTLSPVKGAGRDEKGGISETDSLVQSQIPGSAQPIASLIPSLSFMTFADNGINASYGAGEVNGAMDAYWVFEAPNQIQALASALGWTNNKTVLKKLYSFYNGNANPSSPYINLSAAFPASSVIGTYYSQTGARLSSSNCVVSFTLLEAINHSLAKFAL